MALVVKNPPASVGDIRDADSNPKSENPLEESTATHSSSLFLGESHGQRSLAGYGPQGL